MSILCKTAIFLNLAILFPKQGIFFKQIGGASGITMGYWNHVNVR
jgi:hypothetical protein